MRFVANFVSILCHPLFLVFFLISLAMMINPYQYYASGSFATGAMHFMNFFLLVLFPMVGVAMLAGLKMISNIRMPEREDRIGPLLITLSFYIWYFINIKDNGAYPDSHRFVALGATLAVGLGFFVNNFNKISLHAIGASAFLTSLFLLIFSLRTSFIDIHLSLIGSYRLSSIFALLFATIMAGAVGSSRLYLKAHTPKEVYGGYVLGVFSQIVAFRIYM